jgi:hypothetical protein
MSRFIREISIGGSTLAKESDDEVDWLSRKSKRECDVDHKYSIQKSRHNYSTQLRMRDSLFDTVGRNKAQ